MIERLMAKLVVALLLLIGGQFAFSASPVVSGPLFSVSAMGDVSITLCLNGKGPLSCQNYLVPAGAFSVSTTIPNHTYPIAGIKINTPGFSLVNLGVDCTPYGNGYCLFSVSDTAPHSFSIRNSNGQSLCSATTTLQYNNSNCSPASGCSLAFSCPLTSSQPGSFNMNISSLTINQPALLQTSAGTAPTQWYNNSVSCTRSGDNVTCPIFLPIASDFTIQGTLDTLPFTLNVTVSNDIIPQSACGTAICGGTGTTVQRMFDCSQRVTSYAGYGNGTIVTPFVPGDNPDPNWFLVSSPSASDNQQCFWLAPVMVAANPALGNGTDQFDSFHQPMNGSPYLNGRLLWSGTSTSPAFYTFYAANGNGSVLSNYDEYDAVTNPNITAPFIGTGHVLTNTICQTGGGDPVLLSGSAYNWQMPSYPMIYTLTNTTGHCVGSNVSSVCNPSGFFATSSIPAFSQIVNAHLNIWASSINNNSQSWRFNGTNSHIGSNDPSSSSSTFSVRCVSGTW